MVCDTSLPVERSAKILIDWSVVSIRGFCRLEDGDNGGAGTSVEPPFRTPQPHRAASPRQQACAEEWRSPEIEAPGKQPISVDTAMAGPICRSMYTSHTTSSTRVALRYFLGLSLIVHISYYHTIHYIVVCQARFPKASGRYPPESILNRGATSISTSSTPFCCFW